MFSEYGHKISTLFQELRFEDYAANRKGKQAGTSAFGFGATPAATTQASTGFAFGQSKPAGFGASSKILSSYDLFCTYLGNENALC